MPLKYKLDKLDGLDPATTALYVEKEANGTKYYLLDVDGAVDKSQLDEFRTNNVNLKRQLADATAKFDGIDPDEVKKLKEAVGGLAADEIPELLKKGKDVEKVVEGRTAAMKTTYEKQILTVTSERDKLQSQLAELSINQAVLAEATKIGLRPTAQIDATYRARQVFRLNAAGVPTAYEADGKTIIYGQDTKELTIKEWCEGLKTAAPHLFEESKGAGSSGGSGGNGGGAVQNPFMKGTPHYNVTKQGQLRKENPALARKYAAEAGIVLPA